MKFPAVDEQKLLQRLQHPWGQVRMVLDTDAYNEIDDQYAIAYALLRPDRLNVEAIYAAPFANMHAASPAEGMEKSYEEILRVLERLSRTDLADRVLRGSRGYLTNEDTPQPSDAARDLVRRAMALPDGEFLYVVAIGAISNVASAILMEPRIIEKIVIVWLGGNAYTWPDTREFNLIQDTAAARVVFDCGAAVVQLPCMGVVSHLTTTQPELAHHLQGKSAIADYLYETTCNEVAQYGGGKCWSRVIWDVSAIAWLLGEGVRDVLVHSPIVNNSGRYSFDSRRHFIRCADWVDRDVIFAGMFEALGRA